ncbi:hypothetical protein RCOM_0017280 [Ricinus communis]|uniref:Calmodulin binding protein n=1 Tax=Ricinus communis TaxID=3988 RepID=B9SXK9_RICCO|nr:hypothetical protein RCOM_0017280 [Ricinus communis]|eukprot:XP_002530728.1 uncharacterized protein LOC8267089 [Ricinus communis]
MLQTHKNWGHTEFIQPRFQLLTTVLQSKQPPTWWPPSPIFTRLLAELYGWRKTLNLPQSPLPGKGDNNSEMARMRTSRKWFDIVRRKFFRSSRKTTTVILHSNACSSPDEAQTSGVTDETAGFEELMSEISLSSTKEITQEDIAALRIQATFRGHLARRAFQALRSLVKVQALVRGAYVRKQTRIALHCMHALVRLQVRIRARQLLGRCSDE